MGTPGTEHRDSGGHQVGVVECRCSIDEVLAIFQSNPRRPSPLMRKLDKRPNRCVEAVQKNGPLHAGALEHGGDVVCDLSRNAQILFLDFNQDAENPSVIGKVHKALRIGDGGKPRLDPDPAMPKQFHDGRRVGFRQVYRGVVGQFVPPGDGIASLFLIRRLLRRTATAHKVRTASGDRQ